MGSYHLLLSHANNVKDMLEENMEENVNAFFYHLGVRNVLLRTQNEEITENSDTFYYAKMIKKKKHYFCTGEIYQKQSEKVNWT